METQTHVATKIEEKDHENRGQEETVKQGVSYLGNTKENISIKLISFFFCEGGGFILHQIHKICVSWSISDCFLTYWRPLYMIKILTKCYCPTAHIDCSSLKIWGRNLPGLKSSKSWATLLQRKRTKMPLLLQTHKLHLKTLWYQYISTDWLIQVWLTVFINSDGKLQWFWRQKKLGEGMWNKGRQKKARKQGSKEWQEARQGNEKRKGEMQLLILRNKKQSLAIFCLLKNMNTKKMNKFFVCSIGFLWDLDSIFYIVIFLEFTLCGQTLKKRRA